MSIISIKILQIIHIMKVFSQNLIFISFICIEKYLKLCKYVRVDNNNYYYNTGRPFIYQAPAFGINDILV